MANCNKFYDGPQLVWVIKPENKIRFRYESEGGSHGGLAGTLGKKTFPTLELVNYHGEKKVFVRVSLYTEDNKEHVLEFKGRKTERSKPYIDELVEGNQAVFKNLQILSKKKDEIEKILLKREMNNLKDGLCRAARAVFEKNYAKRVKERARTILNSARLHFMAYEEGSLDEPLCTLFSDVISNQKAASKGELRICRLSHVAGSWRGGDEVFLLCDKVQKENIKVKFYETNEHGFVIWEEYGTFSAADVHYQVAIAFKTPPYKENADKKVFICLERNGELSEPRDFTYKAEGPPAKKRKVVCNEKLKLNIHPPETASSEDIESSDSGTSSMTISSPESAVSSGMQSASDLNSDDSNLLDSNPLQELLNGASYDDIINNIAMMTNIDLMAMMNKDIFTDCDMDVNLNLDENKMLMASANMGVNTHFSNKFNMQSGENKPLLASANMGVNTHFSNKFNMQSGENNPLLASANMGDNTPFSNKFGIQSDEIYGQMDDTGTFLPEFVIKSNDSVDGSVSEDLSQKLTLKDKSEDTSEIQYNCYHRNNKLFSKERKNLKPANTSSINKKLCYNLLLKRDETGNTLLHIAVLLNKDVLPILKLCYKAKVHLMNTQNFKEQTALHIAVEKSNFQTMQVLLQLGANPNLKDYNGNSCYHIIAKNNNSFGLKIINTLSRFTHNVEDFNDEGLTPLHIAIMQKPLSHYLFDMLRIHMTNSNILEKKAGKSLLHYAVTFHPSILSSLLQKADVDVNIQDFDGNTPLHIACINEDINTIMMLLQSGADPSIKNFKQNSNSLDLESTEEDDVSDGQLPADLTTNIEILKLLRNATKEEIEDPLILQTSDNSGESDEIPCLIKDKLCKYLDDDMRWKKLATYFLDTDMIESLELGSSPTKVLLDYMKRQEPDGYLEKIKMGLEFANLQDAKSIISVMD